ncbi:MAG: intradiol ring-cleavage dioxygenase [Alphaproteobacteria bacterium]
MPLALSRRRLLIAGGSAVGVGLLVRAAHAQACAPGGTPPQTEGPYYTPGTPLRSDFTGDGPGVPLLLEGFVTDAACLPLGDAVVDIWHANADGIYDNDGYRFRGYQRTDAAGRYWLRTIVPGLYGRRTRHIHVKAQAAGTAVLTTQLYFPDEPANASDRLFDPALAMAIGGGADGLTGRFDFVLSA